MAVLLLALALPAIPAGRRPFWSQDEARFAVLARDALEHGHWRVGEIRGRPYLNKPQLYFWGIAALSLPGGQVTERTASIPSILSSAATVGAVVAIGRLLWGWPTGLLAGLILVASPVHFLFAHVVLPDPMLVAWLTWALWAYLAAAHRAWSPRLVAVFYGCVGGALLTKGPVALVALVAAGLSVVLTDGWRALARTRPVWGAVILAVSALPWIVPYYTEAHQTFSHDVVEDQYVRWVIQSPSASGARDIVGRLGHLASALPAFLPWTLLLVGAALWWFRAPDRGRRRLLVWTVVWWLGNGFSGNFRDRYLLVVYPLFALLAAELAATAAERRGRPLATVSLVTTAVLIGAGPIAVSVAPGLLSGESRVFAPDASWERLLLSGIALVGAGLALRLTMRGALTRATAMLTLTTIAVLAVEGVTYPARYTRLYDIGPVVALLQRGEPGGAPVIGHPDLRLSYDFYLRRPVLEVLSAEALLTRLTDAPPAAIVTSAERWNALAPRAPPGWHVTGTALIADRAVVVVARSTP